MRNASDTEADFRKHVFFSQMDWNQIEARSIDAPIITTTRDRKTRDGIEKHIDNICQFHHQSNTFREWCTHRAKMTIKEMISISSVGTNGREKCWKLCTASGMLKTRIRPANISFSQIVFFRLVTIENYVWIMQMDFN